MSVARYPFQTGHSELLTNYPKYSFPPNQFSGSDVTVQTFQDRLNVADNFHSLAVRDTSACSSRCSSPFIEAHRRDNSPSINTPSSNVIDQPAVIQTKTKSKKESCDECKVKTSLCLKRLCTFMLSHVGLAALVVVYTFIGGTAFCYMERDFEMKIQKSVITEHERLVQNVMNSWRESQLEVFRTLQSEFDTLIGLKASATTISLLNGASSNKPDLSKIRIKSEADRDKLIAGLKWYFAGLGWPRRILPPWWFNYTDGLAELPISTEPSDQKEPTSSGEDNLSDASSERLFVMTNMKDLNTLIDKVALKMQEQVERSIRKNLKTIIKAIKDDGWNGADNVDDLNWTIEGGILYAVTIITTIGYGHVTPHTPMGRIVTMLYAVFGIPLFFCYLSNNGNYLADLFQTCYVRMCRPTFQAIGNRCCKSTCVKKTPTRKYSRVTVQEKLSSNSILINSSAFPHQPSASRWTPLKNVNETNSNQLLLWTEAHNAFLNNHSSGLGFCNTYPKSPAYRLTDDWEPHVMSLSVDCNVEKPISRPYVFREPNRLDSIQQPPSPYMERVNRLSRESNTSTTSSVPTSPSPLLESASKSTLLGPRDKLDDLHEVNHEQQHIHTDVHHLTEAERKVSDQRSKKISQTKPPSVKQEQVTVPISLTVFMMTVYILIGATVFTFWESEDYVKWAYFCFITLSTIGFGDIVPGTKVDSQNPKEKMIILAIYMAVGLSVFAMCFNLMQEEVTMKMKRFGRRVGLLRPKSEEGTDAECRTMEPGSDRNEATGIQMETVRINTS